VRREWFLLWRERIRLVINSQLHPVEEQVTRPERDSNVPGMSGWSQASGNSPFHMHSAHIEIASSCPAFREKKNIKPTCTTSALLHYFSPLWGKMG